MSKYEDAIRIKAVKGQLVKAFERQIVTEARYRTGLQWAFNGLVEEEPGSPFEPSRSAPRRMAFSTTMYHQYTDSSGRSVSDGTDSAGREIAETLSELKALIIPNTIARLRKEIADAAVAARGEAVAILAAAKVEDKSDENPD